MVKEYDLSESVGQVYFAREKRVPYLSTPLSEGSEYSQSTAELIDNEVRQIIARQYEQASNILQEKRAVLETGAKLLLEREKIDGEEPKALMGEIIQPPEDPASHIGQEVQGAECKPALPE